MRGGVEPAQTALILLTDIEVAGKAEMKDGKLVIVNLDESDSTIYVYALETDIAQHNPEGTVVRVYNRRTLRQENLEITSFEIVSTVLDNQRIMFITNATKRISAYLLNRTSYEIGNSSHIDLVKTLQGHDLYFTSNTLILNTKILATKSVKDKQEPFDVYRMLLVTLDTYVYELDIVCSHYQNGTYKFRNVTPGYAYQTYGTGTPRPHISVYNNLFGISYWTKDRNYELAVVFYSAPPLPDNLAELSKPVFRSIIGGQLFNYITDTEVYARSFFQIFPILSMGSIGVLTPHPQLKQKPVLLQINDPDYLKIVVKDLDFESQDLTLKVFSDFAETIDDIRGFINITSSPIEPVPIDPSYYPAPYCKLIKSGYTNIFTSLGETVQYKIGDYFEGYNLEVKGNYSTQPEYEVARIVNSVEQVGEKVGLDQKYFVNRYSAFHTINGDDYIARLFELEYDLGYSKYFVQFQKANETY